MKPKFKDAKRTNFVVGDKVIILPSAVDNGVSIKDVGKIGTITQYVPKGDYFCVLMDYENKDSLTWAVYHYQMEQVIKIGQQLLFDFMK